MRELMEKMAGQDMKPKSSDLEAKMEVLRELHEMASQLLAGELEGDSMDDDMSDMPGMDQVTVAAADEEGLEEGLDKAKELLKKKEDLEDDLY